MLLRIALAAILLLAATPALAQHNHAQHHPTYQNWTNQDDRNCCNNQDCGELKDENERETAAGGVEVKIEGQWCPVKPRHYLKKGNAPNWSTSHVCVRIPYYGDDMGGTPSDPEPPCERLLCYQPKPGI